MSLIMGFSSLSINRLDSPSHQLKVGFLLLVSCTVLAAGSYADLLTALSKRESSGNATIVNEYGYAGLYQMGETALIDSGYYKRDGTKANDWQGTWTGKDGINSLNDFLNNPGEQTAAITTYQNVLWDQITAKEMDSLVGQTYQGVTITESGLIAAAHLIGASGLKNCLSGGSCTDANNTTALSYMSQFGGYDVSSVTGSASTNSGSTVPTSGATNTAAQISAPTSNTNIAFPVVSSTSSSDAFSESSNVSLDDLHNLVLGVLTVTLLLLSTWVTRAQFSNWRNGKITLMQMQTGIISCIGLLSAVLLISLS
jgi:hypothetical protein